MHLASGFPGQAKAIPKDVDILVKIDGAVDLNELARVADVLDGIGSNDQLGADVFLADAAGRYLGRICNYRECHH